MKGKTPVNVGASVWAFVVKEGSNSLVRASSDRPVPESVMMSRLRLGRAPATRPSTEDLRAGVHMLFADDQTTLHYASVFRQLRRRGTPIPTNDMWLAALVLQHNLVLHARGKHFDHLPQLVRG